MKTKKGWLAVALLAFAALFATVSVTTTTACSAMGRVTTPQERLEAHAALDWFEGAFNAAALSGAIAPLDIPRGREDIADLRKLIDSTETIPVTGPGLLLKVTNLSLRWLNRAPPPAGG